jgi:hypothetical protein
MLDCLSELLRVVRRQRLRSAALRLDGCAGGKGDIVAGMSEGVTSQLFSETVPLQFIVSTSVRVWVVLSLGCAIGKRVVFISFLRVSVGTNLRSVCLMKKGKRN